MEIAGQTCRGAIPAWGREAWERKEQRAARPRSPYGFARVVMVFTLEQARNGTGVRSDLSASDPW